jgi:hypothetical protein
MMPNSAEYKNVSVEGRMVLAYPVFLRKIKTYFDILNLHFNHALTKVNGGLEN